MTKREALERVKRAFDSWATLDAEAMLMQGHDEAEIGERLLALIKEKRAVLSELENPEVG